MVPTLPPEIWLRTALFIPSRILRNLYSVNSVFLDLALNIRYNDIDLTEHCQWAAATTKLLKHLNHPHIAHRVRRLTLSSNWLESNEYLGPSEEITLWTSIAWHLPSNLGRIIDPIVCRISDAKTCNALMESTVLNFPNVSSLVIINGFDPSSQTRPNPLLVNAYNACASNLRTLTLFATSGTGLSTNLNVLFPLDASVLTSLEEVTFYFYPPHEFNTNVKAASTFFQAIASTLTSLNMTVHETSGKPSQLLLSLPRQGGKAAFPKLTSFSLSHLGPPTPDSNLMEFLNQHADTLKHLRLQHTKMSAFASQSPVLPHLETLDILHGSSSQIGQELVSSEGLDAARAYLQHSRSTLTSLSLMCCSFTLHDLGMVLNLLGRGSSENAEGGGLKNLTVAVQVLSPQVLDMVAEELPQLERLKVDFIDLRINDDLDVPSVILGDLAHEDINLFLLHMRTRSYSMWSLRSFGINRGGMKPETAMAILMPLTLCIPHLVEIDGPFVKMWREPGSTWKASDCDDSISNDEMRGEAKQRKKKLLGCSRLQLERLENLIALSWGQQNYY